MVVIEEGRCVYANAAFEQISGYAFGELAAMESLSGLVERELDVSGPQLTLRRRDGATARRRGGAARAGARAAPDSGPPARRQMVVVAREVTARQRTEDERERLLRRAALLAEASAVFDQSLDEERTLDSVARLCVRDLADTCLVVLGA